MVTWASFFFNPINTPATMNERKKLYLPLLFAALIIVGMFIGAKLTPVNRMLGGSVPRGVYQYSKIQDIIHLLDQKYVDPVDKEELINLAIQQMMEHLDPHSVYITAGELAAINEEITGNFEGIGVQFNIRRDTVMVLNIIPGGPAEQEGVLGGDRIVEVDGEIIAGNGITNEEVMRRLKGPRGTRVEVGVFRPGRKDIVRFTITRDVIRTESLQAFYMLDARNGYIRINTFTANTYREFIGAMRKLSSSGMEQLVLDLRGNGGGLFDQAIRITNEFLGKRDMIVFTRGKNSPQRIHNANGKGQYQQLPIVVLIDEFSASASEIVAGAIQDHDRGKVVGRRSFGKGLVQQQIPLSDGSALRVTTERYYTPSGRSIQRPYLHSQEEYFAELHDRFLNENTAIPDTSAIPDSLKFKTLKAGRTVYGGGGITPDHFIPSHSQIESPGLRRLIRTGILFDFAYDFADRNRHAITERYDADAFVTDFTFQQDDIQSFRRRAEHLGVAHRELTAKAEERMLFLIKAHVARNIYGEATFFKVYNQQDEAVQKAIRVMKQG